MLCTARPLTGCLEGARRRSLDKAVRRRSSRCAQARFHCDLCLAVATRPYLWRSGFYPLAVSCEAIGRSTTLPAHFLNDNMVATLPSLFRKHLRVRLAGRDGINRSRVVATGTPRTGKSPSLNPVTKLAWELCRIVETKVLAIRTGIITCGKNRPRRVSSWKGKVTCYQLQRKRVQFCLTHFLRRARRIKREVQICIICSMLLREAL